MIKLILHVEDDADDIVLFREIMDMTEGGCPIQAVADGQSAIDYLTGAGDFQNREAHPFPALVLLDLKLPVVQGLEVLKWIKSEAKLDVPVVILTSSPSEKDIAAAYKLGANAYLIKPCDMDHYREMIKMIKGFWLTQNTPPPAIKFEPDTEYRRRAFQPSAA